MNPQKGKEQQGMMYSQSSGALLARLRPQNDNIIKAMNGSASAATLNTLRPPAMNTIHSAPVLQSNEAPKLDVQAKVAKLKSNAGLSTLNKTISTSASAMQLSANPEIKAQFLHDHPDHPDYIKLTDTLPSSPSNDTRMGTLLKAEDDGRIFVSKNSFIGSLNLSQQQIHDLYKVPHTFYYLRQKYGANSVYDLELVSLDNVDKSSYFTLSKEGVTQFNNKLSTFTGLNQWEREFRLFHKIIDINFFRVYRYWKSFTVWRKGLRYGKMENSSNKVENTLFIFNPPLRKALLHVRTMTMPLAQTGMLSLPKGETFNLEDFLHAQAVIHEELRLKLRQLSVSVLSTVRSACDEVVDQFLKINNIAANHKMTFMERAALRSECKKLTRFLRMMDILMADFLKTMVHDAMLKLVEAVESENLDPRIEFDDNMDRVKLQRKREAQNVKTPLFRIIASFRRGGGQADTVEDAFQLAPMYDSLVRALDGVVNDCLDVIGTFVKVLTAPETEMYVMPTGDDDEAESAEPEDMVSAIRNGPTYVHSRESIHTHIRSAFNAVKEYLNIFEPYRQIHLKNLQNVTDIAALCPSGEVEAFQNIILEYKDQIEQFTRIPRYADVGVMFVDSADLKEVMIPSPMNCLMGIKAYLPELINNKAQELVNEVGAMNPILSGEPTTVEAYVNKKKVKDAAALGLEEYNNRQSYIRSLVHVMDDNGWPAPDHVKALMRMLKDSLLALEANIQLAEGKEEEETKKFSVQVTDECPKVVKKLAEVREQLDSSLLSDPDGHDEKVVKFLAQQEADFQKLKARIEKIQEYQTILRLPVDDFEVTEEIGSDLNLKVRLWNDRVEWTKLRTRIMETPINQLDVQVLERELARYNKTVAMTSKGLPLNKVVPKLKASVDEINPVLPIITDLRNPAMQPRHWEQITKLIGFNILEQEDFSLADLLTRGVTKYQEEISTIATAAQQESILEEMMAKVTGIWDKLSFEVKPYKDTKGLYILGDTSEVIASLDDSLVTINTVLGSRYVAGIRQYVDNWRSKLMLFQETLDEWLTCQRNWMYLEPFSVHRISFVNCRFLQRPFKPWTNPGG